VRAGVGGGEVEGSTDGGEGDELECCFHNRWGAGFARPAAGMNQAMSKKDTLLRGRTEEDPIRVCLRLRE
jgi:hypothetical protein